jgi:hypothetical protein
MLAYATAAAARRATGIAPRTLRRWLRWWQGPFVETAVFPELSARLVPAVSRRRLPESLLERISGSHDERLSKGARVARAADDGERGGRSTIREGHRMTCERAASTQKMARPYFSRAA